MSDWARDGNEWRHRPWWKVAINTVLRWLQPGVARKLVIYTVTDTDTDCDGTHPRVLGYGFGRVLHLLDNDCDGDGS